MLPQQRDFVMSRVALLRPPGPARVMRAPFDMAEPQPFHDPRGPGPHSTLPYREATELLRCIQIMGPNSDAECRHQVLGEPLPTPEFESAAGISSPVPFGAANGRGGRRSATIGRIAVTLLPDTTTRDRGMTDRAETNFHFNRASITWRSRRGVVTSISGPPAPEVTIQTTFGPGVTAASTSGYGRGTTTADVAAGNTSLGFHEGRHGVDFLRYLQANPYPVFTGQVGMPVADVETAAAAYEAAVQAYSADMARISTENTDCVGNTASVSADVRLVCDAAAARAAAAPAAGGGP
jgi:hypothetical protein